MVKTSFVVEWESPRELASAGLSTDFQARINTFDCPLVEAALVRKPGVDLGLFDELSL